MIIRFYSVPNFKLNSSLKFSGKKNIPNNIEIDLNLFVYFCTTFRILRKIRIDSHFWMKLRIPFRFYFHQYQEFFSKKSPMKYFKSHMVLIRFDHWFEWRFCFRSQMLKTDCVWFNINRNWTNDSIVDDKLITCNFFLISLDEQLQLINFSCYDKKKMTIGY